MKESTKLFLAVGMLAVLLVILILSWNLPSARPSRDKYDGELASKDDLSKISASGGDGLNEDFSGKGIGEAAVSKIRKIVKTGTELVDSLRSLASELDSNAPTTEHPEPVNEGPATKKDPSTDNVGRQVSHKLKVYADILELFLQGFSNESGETAGSRAVMINETLKPILPISDGDVASARNNAFERTNHRRLRKLTEAVSKNFRLWADMIDSFLDERPYTGENTENADCDALDADKRNPC